MIYTKDNIVGLKFIHYTKVSNKNPTIYTILKDGDISWRNNKSHWRINGILECLNTNKWIPINKEIQVEIY